MICIFGNKKWIENILLLRHTALAVCLWAVLTGPLSFHKLCKLRAGVGGQERHRHDIKDRVGCAWDAVDEDGVGLFHAPHGHLKQGLSVLAAEGIVHPRVQMYLVGVIHRDRGRVEHLAEKVQVLFDRRAIHRVYIMKFHKSGHSQRRVGKHMGIEIVQFQRDIPRVFPQPSPAARMRRRLPALAWLNEKWTDHEQRDK